MGYTGNEDNEEYEFETPWRDLPDKPWEIRDDTPASRSNSPKKKGNAPVQKVISGVGIGDVLEVDYSKNDELLNTLNEARKESLEEEEERIRLAKQKEEEEAERYRKAQTENVFRERFEREQKEKAEREAREAEEAARLAAELEEKRQNSLLFRLKGNISSKFEQMKENREQKAASKVEERERMKEEAEILKEKQKAEKEQEKVEKTSKEKPVKEKPAKKVPGKKDRIAKPVKDPAEKTDYKYIATHDPITGFPNKVALEEAKPPYKNTGIIYMFVPDFEDIKGKGGSAETAALKHLADMAESNLGENTYHLGNAVFVSLVKKEDMEGCALTATGIHGTIAGVGYETFAGMAVWEGSLADCLESAKQEAISKRNEKIAKKGGKKEKETKQMEYDALLTKDQRNLKVTVRENHESVCRDKTKGIIGEIRARASEILAVMMTDDKFDTLFIIRDVRTFLSLVDEMDFQLDYSYLYILYQGGPQYFGNDEYYSEITKLFDTISEGLRTGHTKTAKDIQKIRGINIFKKIYFQ